MIDAAPEDVSSEEYVTLTEGAQLFEAVHEENYVQTVDQAALNVHVDEAKSKGVTTQNLGCDSYTTLNIVEYLGQIT